MFMYIRFHCQLHNNHPKVKSEKYENNSKISIRSEFCWTIAIDEEGRDKEREKKQMKYNRYRNKDGKD